MLIHRRQLWSRLALAAGLFALVSGPASAADFPDKPVRIVVAYPPGGATDTIARLLAKQLTVQWGEQVIVENKGGASGMIGAETVVRAAPDGYTLLLGYAPEVALNKLVFKSMSYDPATDLVPLSLVATAPLVLAVGPKLPVASLKELGRTQGRHDRAAHLWLAGHRRPAAHRRCVAQRRFGHSDDPGRLQGHRARGRRPAGAGSTCSSPPRRRCCSTSEPAS